MEISNNASVNSAKNFELKNENSTPIRSIIPFEKSIEEPKMPLVTADYALNNHLNVKPVAFGSNRYLDSFQEIREKYKKEDGDRHIAELRAFVDVKKSIDKEFVLLADEQKQKILRYAFDIKTPIDFDGLKKNIYQYANIPINDTLLMKYICVDKYTSDVFILGRYINYLETIAEKEDIFNGDSVSQNEKNVNAYACLDENGLPDKDKIALMKKLHSMSADLTSVDEDIFDENFELFSNASEIINRYQNSDIKKINNEILPALENMDTNYGNLSNEIEKLMNSKNPDFDLKVIQFVRNTHKIDREHNIYPQDLLKGNNILLDIDSEEKLDLYSTYCSAGVNLEGSHVLIHSNLKKEDATDLVNALKGVKSNQYSEDKRAISKLDKFVEIYEEVCEFANDEEKSEFLNKIEVLKNKGFSDEAILMLLNVNKKQYKDFENKILKNFNKLYTEEPDRRIHIDKDLADKYMNLSDEDVKIICDTVGYFTKNIDKLQQHGEYINESEMAYGINLLHESVLEIVHLAGQDVLNSSIELKAVKMGKFIKNADNLKILDDETKELLKEKLNQLSHPRQKVDKLSTVCTLIGKVDDDILVKIINSIKSSKMTEEQKELANDIFSDKNADYSKQIEEFIIKFNVPKEKQDTIRKFLQKEDIQNKYKTPQSYSKQMQIIETKINAIIRNEKIPRDKKEICLKILNEQKQNLIENPDKYTKPRIDDKTMNNIASQVEAHINIPNNDREFNNMLLNEFYKLLDIKPDKNLLNNLQYDNQYFSYLFINIDEEKFKEQLTKLITLIKNNPNKKLTEIIDKAGLNAQTHKLFDENGLDYNRWINFDKNSKYNFTVEVNVEKSLQAAKKNLMKELNSNIVSELDRKEVNKLVQIAKDMNIEKANPKELSKIIKAIEDEIKNNEYWQDKINPYIIIFKEHIKIHKQNIQNIEKLKNSKEDLSVRLWDKNDIGRNLFFGNHVGCCTAIGSFNSFVAPQHLMNSFVNGIEIVDKNGNSMGNSMCYFAKVDGKLAFIIDSFEANGKLGAAQEVTDAVIEYGKQVCSEMGRSDAQIMFGPNYNKLNFDKLNLTDAHTIEIIGRANNVTYIDAMGGYTTINEPNFNRCLYEIK